MKISMEEKKAEALERMKMFGYWSNAREAFRKSGKPFVNEPPFGAVYDMEDEVAESVAEFEKEHNALVYIIVRAFTAFGVCDSYLFVGDEKEEWECDREDIKSGVPFTYTVNKDAPDCSEFGSIGVRLGAGAGLVRTA